MKKTFIVALSLLAIAVGCSKKSTTAPAPEETTAAEYLSQGWTSFSSGNYSTAQANFSSAIGKDAALADAYNGKGWCQGILGSPSNALATFKAGLARSGTNNDIKAGLAFTYSAMDSSAQAVSNGQAVLLADSLWQFGHTYRESPRDNALNYREICLLLAQNYFKTGQFPSALLWVQKLNPGYPLVDTATPAGQASLQCEIERLAGTM